MTDGSVPALCDQLTRISRVPIYLRDAGGQGIVTAPVDGGGPPWAFVDELSALNRARMLIALDPCNAVPTNECYEAPLLIGDRTIGALVLCGSSGQARPAAGSEPPPARRMHTALRYLAASVSEACGAQEALHRRVDELDALYKLSTMLVEGGDPDRLLELALDLAMNVLGADAGSVAVIDGQTGEGARPAPGGNDGIRVTIKSSRGLSRDWLDESAPMSYGGSLRDSALAGKVVRVDDFSTDGRIADRARAEREGLRSLLSTGLTYNGRPVGLIRLYTRSLRQFTEDEGELLRAIAEHAAAAIITARLRRLREEDERIQRQVRMATDVQRRMLPRSTPRIPRLDVAAWYSPSFELGGDFYDFIDLGGHLGIVVGDVVGKGVAAALLMSAVRASLRAHAQDVYEIGEVLSRVNAALVRDTLDHEFATLWYGVIDPAAMRLTYCGAGHEWPLLIRPPRQGVRPPTDDDVTRLNVDGMALGIDASQRYAKGFMDLEPGDLLVAYSDGLTDAPNFENKRFGGKRLRRVLLQLLTSEPHASASRVVDHIRWELRQFSGLAGRGDDVTLVAVRVGS